MGREFDYIHWVRSQLRFSSEVLLGPGDDCAAFQPGSLPLIVTTDTITEGTDFLLESSTPFQIGRKAMGVNLSDIAAMAGTPRYALVSLVTRAELGQHFLEEVFRGLNSLAHEFGVQIIGGDTNSWSGGLVVGVTLIGEAAKPVPRSGAKPGDWIFVTGPCGGSLLGRHLEPRPRILEIQQIAQMVKLHALIDISDGLAADLSHILEESQVGAVLYGEHIPIHPDAVTRSEQTGRTPLDHALNDGEDFELIFTVDSVDGEGLQRHSPLASLRHIGEIVEADAGLLLEVNDQRERLVPRGWEHTV